MVNRNFTEEFKFGVKEGDPLSATLFSLVIETILKQMELRENITTRLKQRIAYADDILLTTRTKQSLLDTFQELQNIGTIWANCKWSENKLLKRTRKN